MFSTHKLETLTIDFLSFLVKLLLLEKSCEIKLLIFCNGKFLLLISLLLSISLLRENTLKILKYELLKFLNYLSITK